jgi:hypothetical protein
MHPANGINIQERLEASKTEVVPRDQDVDPPAFPRAPDARYKARPEGEWQGMLVDLSTQPPCLE